MLRMTINSYGSVTDGPPTVGDRLTVAAITCWRVYCASSNSGCDLAARAGSAPRGWSAYIPMGVGPARRLLRLADLRAPNQSSEAIDGWGVAAFEVVVKRAVHLAGLSSRRRTIPLMLGLGNTLVEHRRHRPYR